MLLYSPIRWMLNKPLHMAAVVAVFLVLHLIGLPITVLLGVLVALAALQGGVRMVAPLLGMILLVYAITWWHGVGVDLLNVTLDTLFLSVMALLLGRFSSWRLVLELMVALGVILVTSALLLYPHVDQWWLHQLQTFVQVMRENLPEVKAADWLKLEQSMSKIAPYMTGIVVGYTALFILIQLIAARAIQAGIFNPGGLAREFIQLRIGYLLSIFWIVILVGAFFHLAWCYNILPVICFPILFAGLSLCHFVARTRKQWVWGLCIVYIALFFFGVQAILVLSLLAVIDGFVDIRQYVAKNEATQN